MKIDQICVVFENCECVEIPYTDVRYLHLCDISEQIWDNNISLERDFELKPTKHAKSARLIVLDKAEYHRIKRYNDITYIELLSDGKSIEYINIRWKNEDGRYSNNGQTVTETGYDGGWLDIRINMDEEVE